MGDFTRANGHEDGHEDKLRVVYFSNEFPNDDLPTLLRQLHNHSKDVRHKILANFMDAATQALHDEVRRSPTELQKLVPSFQSIITLAEDTQLRKGRLCGSIDGVLLCVVQLATYIGHYESHPQYTACDNTVVTGLGIGLLVASAIALSPSLEDLPIVGAEVIRLAFRLGVLVADVSQNLDAGSIDGSSESWAYVVQAVTPDEAQAELDRLQPNGTIAHTTRVFISAKSPTSVTISGPPSRLKALLRDSEFFGKYKHVALPVFGGLCHASHIYGAGDVQALVQPSVLHKRYTPQVPLLSSNNGRPFPAQSGVALFGEILSEIMTQQIVWDNVVDHVVSQAVDNSAHSVEIVVFRVSLPVNQLTQTLEKRSSASTTNIIDLLPWISTSEPDRQPRTPLQSKIAIVGMACRMPGGATDTDKFWDLLEKGYDVHRKIPADRFDVETHYDPTGKRMNTSQTPYGCFIDEPGLFDAPFFNMSPREAEQTDPMQRLALVTAYEALERAGYVPNRTPATNLNRIGVWYGQASDDYREVNTAQEISTYFIPGGCRAFGPGRINYFFKFSGPSFSCDTACSSSLATIQAACTALWSGEVDTIVAGGMNVLTNSDAFAGLSNGYFLSKTANACKTWDNEADGYCRADGIGSIVLKRLEDAEADNDNIYGVILGAATNHSAEAVSITHPHAGAQSYLYRHVLSKAGIDPLDVNYVELHGTGTQAGDSVEIKSISDVFAPMTRRRTSKQPLHIGAVKANVGHGEAAAGVTALLKVLLMLQKSAIPPHVGIKNGLNTKFPKDLDARNLRIPYERTEWPHVPGRKRTAVVNNFSAAGGNTTIALEEGPMRVITGFDTRPEHVIVVSAKSKISVRGNIERLVSYLDKHPDLSLADLAYTTTARRYHHNQRIAIHTSGVEHLKRQLSTSLTTIDSLKSIPTTGPPSIAFTFTGQGSADKTSDLQLYHGSPIFRDQIMHLDTLCQRQGFPSFIPAIDGRQPKDYAHPQAVSQLALLCTEIALAKYWESLGVKPDVVVGHSLGEYAALCVAGVLSASDAIFLVGSRARMLEAKCQVGSHMMLAVKASMSEIEGYDQQITYEIACKNGPQETVLSGTVEQMDAAALLLKEAGFRCTRLDVAFAFHSAQTDPILDEFEHLARSIIFQAPKLPVVSPLLGKVICDDKTLNAEYVRRATRETCDFHTALLKAHEMSFVDKDTAWVEIGPHPICTSFIKASLPSVNVAVPSLRKGENNWTTLARTLGSLHCAGVEIRWAEFHRPFENTLQLLDLPTYSWNDKNHWIQYNGDWALTKGNTFYDAEKAAAGATTKTIAYSGLATSTVQQIVEEIIDGASGRVVMQSDLMQPEFLAAAHGHNMNGCGVVTSSIHADIAYTLGKYLYAKLAPKVKHVDMNIADLDVVKGLVAQNSTKTPQRIQVALSIQDTVHPCVGDLTWHNVNQDGTLEESAFATAKIIYGDAQEWLDSWTGLTHLVQSRIEDLQRRAAEGTANRFSHNMAYTLFAQNLVDYAAKYRGMQAVTLKDFEAFADVTLSKESAGTWTVPPYYIDSVAHLAGFIMNVSDASDTVGTFCVTPGWSSMRFARPLVAGASYRSYVKMIPSTTDPSTFFGDVYVLQDGAIMGMVGGIQFRRYPRILLNRFFSAPDTKSHTAAANSGPVAHGAASKSPSVVKNPSPVSKKPSAVAPLPKAEDKVQKGPTDPPPTSEVKTSTVELASETVVPETDSVAAKAVALIAAEAGLMLADLPDEASFGDVGVDSLMSLVIAEKFVRDLGINVSSSLFLEYPTIGALKSWLQEYYS